MVQAITLGDVVEERNRRSFSEDASVMTSDLISLVESDDESETPLALQETKAVNAGKILVLLVLLLAAGAMGFLTYWYTSQDEQNTFETSFENLATEIISVTNSNAEQTINIISSISTAVTSHAFRMDLRWPFVTIPDFEVRCQEALEQSGAELIMFTPVVSKTERDLWGIYSVQNQGWIKEGLATQGKEDVDPGSVIPAIRGVAPGHESFAPLWQYAPAPTTAQMVNLDLFSTFPWFARLAKGVQECRHELLSEQVNMTLLVPGDHIRSVSVYPVFDSFQPDAQIFGFLSAVLPWDHYFANVLPPGTKRLDVEVTDTCGSAFTYFVEGPVVSHYMQGLHHDSAFDSFRISGTFAQFASLAGTAYNNATNASCVYTLAVYPTAEFKSTYESGQPIYYTGVVLAVFLFTALVFVLYDWLVRRRQQKVMNTAQRTNAIVASMFPKNVQKRILAEAETKHAARYGGGTGPTSKSELKQFLGEQDGRQENGQYADKPIADLFPETTILFADIVGFTAWSSAREPSQVFVLLETIYGHFDEIASRRRVFKVETVGDCYVAVAGLPDPCKDHAVVMARFANECLEKFGVATKGLEVELGPDTSDLNIRVGLHSGPVTAGVLRGNRARFQLFGDTMNTASRMESNSKPGCIHVTQETADLLVKAGKRHWVTKREERIVAKGKGEMDTYWVNLHSHAPHMLTTNDKQQSFRMVRAENGSALRISFGDVEHSVIGLPARIQRLIDWNVDVLMRLLRAIEARRLSTRDTTTSASEVDIDLTRREGCTVLDEVQEIIPLPKFDAKAAKKEVNPDSIVLSPKVAEELHEFVTAIALMYRDNPFHNFEHCSHVAMSVSKLLSRIVAPSDIEISDADGKPGSKRKFASTLHDHTYGITSDPLTQFACVFSALIHDVDHTGVPNFQLIKENPALAKMYREKSVAEQNSVDLAWDLLMDDGFANLRGAIFSTNDELLRFRHLVVNSVMATDIMDKDLKALRNARWDKVFSEGVRAGQEALSADEIRNRKATIVIEHIIQASDIAHTMQHWHVYRKWNERLFREMYKAYKAGRADKDPSDLWYKGEIGFFDFYIIPLAEKLKACGVFGVSSVEYLNYAQKNRAEWEERGQQVVEEMLEAIRAEETESNLISL